MFPRSRLTATTPGPLDADSLIEIGTNGRNWAAWHSFYIGNENFIQQNRPLSRAKCSMTPTARRISCRLSAVIHHECFLLAQRRCGRSEPYSKPSLLPEGHEDATDTSSDFMSERFHGLPPPVDASHTQASSWSEKCTPV